VNHYLIEVLRLLYLSLVLKLAADATFNFGTVLIFFLSKVIIGLESSIIIGLNIASTSEYKTAVI
jgi:hypothetical protein